MNTFFAAVGAFENLNVKNKSTAVFEIVTMLLGAFILGYLLHWLICRGRGHVTSAAATTPKMHATSLRRSQPDDLTIVEGIGPKIEQLLNADGISTFADLAAAPTATVADILAKAGPRYQIHDPGTWGTQAALARDGKMAELEALKERLNGGK